MRNIAATGALLGALCLTAAAVSGRTIGVTIKNHEFVPAYVGVRDGDTIKICNSDPTIHAPFSMSKGNQFGDRKHMVNWNLRPGACMTRMVHNQTGGPIEMHIFDAIHDWGQLNVTIASRSGVRAKPSSVMVWSETESGWEGVWTQRAANSNVYDAVWTNGGNRNVTATLEITISGNQVTIHRTGTSDKTNCEYSGTISNGIVSGTYGCTGYGGPFPWSATRLARKI